MQQVAVKYIYQGYIIMWCVNNVKGRNSPSVKLKLNNTVVYRVKLSL